MQVLSFSTVKLITTLLFFSMIRLGKKKKKTGEREMRYSITFLREGTQELRHDFPIQTQSVFVQ